MITTKSPSVHESVFGIKVESIQSVSPSIKRCGIILYFLASLIGSFGVGTSPCIIPATGKPSFKLEDNEMEFGIGHHGEPGIKKVQMKNADDTTTELMDYILEDLPFKNGDTVSVLINGLGATPLQELFIVNRKVTEILEKYKIKKLITYVGEYFSSLEMAGFSITLTKVDQEIARLILAKADSPLFKQFDLNK